MRYRIHMSGETGDGKRYRGFVKGRDGHWAWFDTMEAAQACMRRLGKRYPRIRYTAAPEYWWRAPVVTELTGHIRANVEKHFRNIDAASPF